MFELYSNRELLPGSIGVVLATQKLCKPEDRPARHNKHQHHEHHNFRRGIIFTHRESFLAKSLARPSSKLTMSDFMRRIMGELVSSGLPVE